MLSRSAQLRLLSVGFWILFGVISGLQIQISMLSHHHSWALVIGYQVLVWSAWIPFTFAIWGLLRRVPVVPPRATVIALHVAVAIAFIVAHVAAWVAVELWLRPYDFMNPTTFEPRFEGVLLCQLPFELFLYGFIVFARLVADSSARARERERRTAQLETSLAEARLHALELQIRPHFLFNTLNGISSLVRAGQNKDAVAMIGGLSDLLRYALDRAGGQRVALEEETAMAGRYLEIQRLRFPDRLTVDFDVAKDVRRAAVPVLLLQPLVENAVRHGIEKSEAPGRIAVRAERQGDEVTIRVWNSGRLDGARKDGIGLSTTIERLAQSYGARARFELAAADGGVASHVVLPWSEMP